MIVSWTAPSPRTSNRLPHGSRPISSFDRTAFVGLFLTLRFNVIFFLRFQLSVNVIVLILFFFGKYLNFALEPSTVKARTTCLSSDLKSIA